MTSLTTLSSDKRNQLEVILRRFLEGGLSLTQVQEALRGYIVIEFDQAPMRREIRNNQLDRIIEIPVKESHVRHALRRYIDGNLSDLDLSNWAAFVFMVYVPQGQTEEERYEAGDGSMWDILQRLMTPSIFDGLTPQVAERYFRMLM